MLRRVVLIDDSEPDLLFTSLIIERSGTVQAVRAFDSASEALAWLLGPESHDVDLVLLDINMPGMDGFAFLSEYERSTQGRSAPPVVMLTSSPDPDDQRRAQAHDSVRGYVVKPITLDVARDLARHAQG
ncbi:MAG TPA: response regulator [Burkholderiaceae bacterium]|nr:response regulator [Burkholderiaceae bacterium]